MRVSPYGDTLGDGIVQLSFTLPLPVGPVARLAAEELCRGMNLEAVQIAHTHGIADGYTFFVVYARARNSVDMPEIATIDVEIPSIACAEADSIVSEKIGRSLVVVGACTGTDAHTVGLDAILNAKGFHGVPGLERYQAFRVINLGSQVENADLAEVVRREGADAILVSQVVTQNDLHLRNLTHLVDLLEAEDLRDSVCLIVGGPRITQGLALELGFDAGFGPSTTPAQVAAFVINFHLNKGTIKSEATNDATTE